MEERLQKALSLEASKREATEQSLSESRAKIDELRLTIIKSTKEKEDTEGIFKNYNNNFNYGQELLERESDSTMERFMAHQNSLIEKLLEKGGNSGRRYIIDSKTEVFGADRKKDSIREWLFAFEIACENVNVPKTAYITMAIGFTKGLALELVKKHHKKNSTWDELKKELVVTFELVNEREKDNTKLLNLKSKWVMIRKMFIQNG